MSPYSVDSFDVPSLWAPLSRHGWTVGTCAPEVPAGSASQATSPTGPSPDGPASCWDHLHKPFLVCMVWGPRAFFSLLPPHRILCYPLPPFVHPLTLSPSSCVYSRVQPYASPEASCRHCTLPPPLPCQAQLSIAPQPLLTW